jgi:hypothetical protein
LLADRGETFYTDGAGAAIAAPIQAFDVEAIDYMENPTNDRTTRKPVSVRTRFEVFKRDDFTCRYCGRKTPDVILELDHVVPVADGGSNDPMNLVTSCWECNRGKSAVPLNEIITGEDPHDKAIELLERERQLREYNEVLEGIRLRREEVGQELVNYWCEQTGKDVVYQSDWLWLMGALQHTPAEEIRVAMDIAIRVNQIRNWRYVGGIVRKRRDEREALADAR